MRRAIGLLALVFVCVDLMAESTVADGCVARSGLATVPLVELYTSEGCSSCPPADRWLSKRFQGDDANYLAFHVDYWDDIGWPDRFGSPAFAQRQRKRVGATGGSTVYTPQVMLGAWVRADWHNARVWEKSLQQSRVPARAALALHVQRNKDGWQVVVGAAPNGPAAQGAQLWLARYVDGRTTEVRAGENRGETLRHDRVVRELRGPWPFGIETMSQRVDLPAESAPWGVTAFVQNARGEILQSLNLHAAACAPHAAGL